MFRNAVFGFGITDLQETKVSGQPFLPYAYCINTGECEVGGEWIG